LLEKQKIEEIKKNPVLKFEPEHKEEKIKVDPNAPGKFCIMKTCLNRTLNKTESCINCA
jgi:hypothetical protein